MRQSILYLVRHGQTAWNAEDRLQGHIDIPLNEAGVAEAHLLAQEFQHQPIGAIYSSPLLRAQETARIVNVPHQHEIKIYHDLKEATYGSLDGLKRSDFSEKLAAFKAMEKEERIKFKYCPQAESYLEIYSRTKPVLDEIIDNHPGENVIIVTHGGVINALITMIVDIDVRNVRVQNIGYVKLVGDGVKISLQEHKRVEL